ncbi:DUF6538 domain-containing protein [Labrys wisconsinensis]|uniref:Site-specific recombinase XerC n=1 Tax=Labrys wisconsinensis TaxID=425677 RepID=A0ABU0JLT3_9HYPH|nr:DUF6538 domain-containing protein [Labrys wisconsinensis]MDQ0475239.1 site-specific recombinase XerC [Labrys wisconsinensis]
MARPAAADTRYLEQKNGKWRVTLAVPRELQGKLGTRLKRPLHTDSLAVANRIKWQALAELRAVIEHARNVTGKGAIIREAIELAAYRSRARDPEEIANLDDAIVDRAIELQGPVVGSEEDVDGGPVPIFDPEKERAALEFAEVAQGRATPIALYHPDYLNQSINKRRTKADDERSLRFLLAWCERERVRPTLQAITRKVAARFMDDLGGVAGGQSPVTLQKYVSRLSRFWQWLAKRDHVESNPWAGLRVEAKPTPHDELERPFTDAEMLALLNGAASPEMHDLMRIAALSGARLDVIVDLRVKDCAGGMFVFKPQKKETAPRQVPIHSELAAIIKRRAKGKAADDAMFPEWPAPRKVGSQRERSFKASNAFTAYRRQVGVDDVVPGKRRSLVNFHSFRRWFITKAEQADQAEGIIAAVVGHKRKGMTLGRYSAGPLLEQARRCVEAVRLPRQPSAKE